MQPGNVRGRPRRRARATMLVGMSAVLGAWNRPAAACDVCAVYTATEMGERRTGFRLGVAEQFSHFGTLQRDGEEVPNPNHERVDSSITQVLLGYNFTPRFGLQLNLPLITRQFRRREASGVVDGDETGVGDLALVAHVLAASTVTERSVFRFSLLGGLKLPSGSSSRLAEESAEGHHHAASTAVRRGVGAARGFAQHSPGGEDPGTGGGEEEAESGIHGHDLALGSGSVDGLVGAQLFWSWQRLFVTASGQYALRTEGDFGYQYADELTWSAGPGVFALLRHDYTLGLQALATGESKGKDTLDGEPAGDTGVTSVYVGPGIVFTWGSSLAADLVGDIPVVQHNTALQIVPDYRLRGGVTWRF